MRPTSRLGFWLRLAAATGALLATAVLWVHVNRRDWIDAIDLRLEAFLTSGTRTEFLAALAQLPTDRPQALQRLSRLEQQLRGYHSGDRPYALWREIGHTLADEWQRDGDSAQAIALAEKVVQSEAKDLPARLQLARLRLGSSEHHEQGRADIAELEGLLAEEPEVITLAVDAALADGDLVAAARALVAHLRSPRSWLWILRYDGADSPVPAYDIEVLQPRCTADGRLRAECRLPPGAHGVHLDLPHRCWLGFDHVRLTAADGSWPPLLPAEPGRGLRRAQSMWWCDGAANPGLDFELPAAVGQDGLVLAFTAELAQGLPPWLAVRLASPPLAQGLRELQQTGAAGDAALLRRCRTVAACLQPFELFHRGDESTFTGERRLQATAVVRPAAADGLPFRVEFALPAGSSHVRIDPPGITGASFRLLAVEFVRGDVAAATSAAACVDLHDMELRGDVVLVTGDDPHWSMVVPAGAPDRLRVVGSIR
ncbi:MAG TPA: hypothetical protein VK348_04235 [Planctomycetota bacterium]|nr:hypothetical protein [Planctomycetota bacterium]